MYFDLVKTFDLGSLTDVFKIIRKVEALEVVWKYSVINS